MKENTIPTTIRQAFKILDELVTAEEKAYFLTLSKSQFSGEEHFGLGMWIRNNWIYGREEEETPEESELRDRCFRMLSGIKDDYPYFEHPDTVSGRFLEKYYAHLKRTQN